MSFNPRIVVSALGLSAAAFIGIVTHEGFTDKAVVPTINDRPTLGFGSTFHEDGQPVKMGESTTPVRALIKAQAHIGKEERVFRDSLPNVKLHQVEYDVYMDWVYQFGSNKWLSSSMHANLLSGDYVQACKALLRYRFAGGYDCSTLINGKPNRRCWGVWERQKERYDKCMGVQ